MRWKAGALLVGAAVMLSGLSSWFARRADERDERHRTLELTASLAAVRVDAAVSRAATTLALAHADVDVQRLADAIGGEVCRFGEVTTCAEADPSAPGDPGEAFRSADVRRAQALATTASRDAGRPGVAVVTPDRRSPASAIVVVADHPNGLAVGLVPLEPGLVVPAELAGASRRSVAAPLDTPTANGSWMAVAVTDDHIGGLAGLTWISALQVAAGGLITIAAVVLMTRDQRRLRRRATIDGLTGLPNRAEFERLASRRLAQLGRDGTAACLVVVDLDGFKSINDSAGHAAGDRVLAEAGRRLAAAVRATDLVGRWGGDEFVMLLTGIGDPLAIADRTAAIAAWLRDLPADPSTRLSASVGAAAFPLEGRDLATLLDLADRAMYDAKPRSFGAAARADDAVAPAVPWRP